MAGLRVSLQLGGGWGGGERTGITNYRTAGTPRKHIAVRKEQNWKGWVAIVEGDFFLCVNY